MVYNPPPAYSPPAAAPLMQAPLGTRYYTGANYPPVGPALPNTALPPGFIPTQAYINSYYRQPVASPAPAVWPYTAAALPPVAQTPITTTPPATSTPTEKVLPEMAELPVVQVKEPNPATSPKQTENDPWKTPNEEIASRTGRVAYHAAEKLLEQYPENGDKLEKVLTVVEDPERAKREVKTAYDKLGWKKMPLNKALDFAINHIPYEGFGGFDRSEIRTFINDLLGRPDKSESNKISKPSKTSSSKTNKASEPDKKPGFFSKLWPFKGKEKPKPVEISLDDLNLDELNF